MYRRTKRVLIGGKNVYIYIHSPFCLEMMARRVNKANAARMPDGDLIQRNLIFTRFCSTLMIGVETGTASYCPPTSRFPVHAQTLS